MAQIKLRITLIIFLLGIGQISLAAPSEITVSPEKPVAWQGKTLVVIVSGENLKKVTGTIFERKIPFHRTNTIFKGIIGIPLETKLGQYTLQIKAINNKGIAENLKKIVTVKRTKFGKASFYLKPEKMKLLSPKIIAEDWAQIHKEIVKERPAQLWKGKFAIPTKGIITLPFGTYQIINGKRRGQHRGVDITAFPGTKIRAANYGMVVLAKKLKAHGNTVIIDHGQGVFSMYLHLKKILVKKYDIAWKGKAIGLMGASGVSTATHLHWGLSVHDVRVDPMQWANKLL